MEAGKKRGIAVNTLYTIGGALVLNGVLQLLVYPRLAAELGAEANGAVLYIMAFVNILGPSIGQALNNSRLVVRRDMAVSNGDYDILILLMTALGIAGTFAIGGSTIAGSGIAVSIGPVPVFVLAAVLILLTNFRYYGDVEYRLSLNYRHYFIYYCLCGAGYAAGYFLYRLSGNWFWIFLLGEAAALFFVWWKGSIFKHFFRRSEFFGIAARRGSLLVLSYFVTNLTLNYDRLYLKSAISGEAVTQYYVVSLIGKTLVLFIAPINTILISSLTKDNVRLSRRRFLSYTAAGCAAAAVFFLLCQIGTPLFVRLFYPSLYESVKGLVTVVNLTQILAMLSAYLFIVVLTFTGAHYQLLLQCLHLAAVLILTHLPGIHGSLTGFSNSILIANALRIAAVIILGVIFAGQGDKPHE